MNCQRCMKNERAAYRASSDVMTMNVCPACAAEAWELGLTIEVMTEARPTKVDLNGTAKPSVAYGR
jgi:hypothetical protein